MKTTTRNVKNFGKHSELLKITDDPLVYAKDEIQKMNEEYRVGHVEYDFKVDFNERVEHTDDAAPASKVLNIGYFYLQEILRQLKLKDFFHNITAVPLEKEILKMTDGAKDILEVSHNRYKIEDCFQIMKTNFSGRPAFHWTEPRIKAHFLICYTTLLVYRLLEHKLSGLEKWFHQDTK